MKNLEELGISPAPWKVDDQDIIDASGGGLVYYCYSPYLRQADARLIAAAPELYEALLDAVETAEELCPKRKTVNCCDECTTLCHTHKWRAALAKAGGEEEQK